MTILFNHNGLVVKQHIYNAVIGVEYMVYENGICICSDGVCPPLNEKELKEYIAEVKQLSIDSIIEDCFEREEHHMIDD